MNQLSQGATMRRREFIKALGESALLTGTKAAEMRGAQRVGTREFFYRPADSWVGDIIPYYKDGKFRLFFLNLWRETAKHGEGHPWYQVSTEDFIHFTEHGEMLPRGTRDEQDLSVATGCVLEAKGRYHI